MENKKLLTESLHDLDSSLGELLINIESIKAIDTELSYVRDEVGETDKSNLDSMGLTLRDNDHKIVMINDLLRYALDGLIKNYEESYKIKRKLFVEYVKDTTFEDTKNE